jgi:hypothetical protein
MDLLTTCTHRSELQVITAKSLISALYKSRQHLLSLLQPARSSPVVPWQRLLILEILQLHALRSSCHSRPCRILVNSTIALSLLRLPCRAHLNCQPSTNWNFPIVFFITPRRGPHRKHRYSIVACLFVSAGTRYRAVVQKRPIVYPPIA